MTQSSGQIIVKSLGYDLAPGMYYGPDYMVKISKPNAKAFCGMYPLPIMGSETVVAVAKIQHGFKVELTVQNIGGSFYLASSQVEIKDWADIFKVSIKE